MGGNRTFAALWIEVRIADETDLRFCAFADAAFARSCGVGTVAVQRTSPNQTLKTLSGAKSEHGPSL